jgi:hypothetical protein
MIGVKTRFWALLLLACAARPAAADDWAWVDKLRNADAATKTRLKLCAVSAIANYERLQRAVFDFDLRCEFARIDKSGKTSCLPVETYHGKVHWKDGSVRYDFEGRYPAWRITPQGREFLEKTPGSFSVIRNKDMAAHTEINPTWGRNLVVDFPPPSLGTWVHNHDAPMRELDPWAHYADNFRGFPLQEFWESCRAIESKETGNLILLRFLGKDGRGRTEIYCDKNADYLPVKTRAGPIADGEFIVAGEVLNEWGQSDGVWYPLHYLHIGYWGSDRKPVKEYDLTVRNLKVNEAARVPDDVFTLSSMALPDGSGGFDRRTGKGLIKVDGVVRQSRPGDRLRQPKPADDRGS